HHLPDLIRIDVLAGARGHEGGHRLTPSGIGNPDHSHCRHPGAARDDVFDLTRVHVERPRDDDVLLPIHQIKEPGLVAHGEVARVKPAALQRGRGLLRLIAVPGHHDPGPHAHLPDLAVIEHLTVVTEDLDPGPGHGPRPRPPRPKPAIPPAAPGHARPSAGW